MSAIYAIVKNAESDEYRYVGLTKRDPNERFAEHVRAARRGVTSALYSWIRKHGEDAISLRILEFLPGDDTDELEAWEIYYIDLYRRAGHRLLNLTDGGGLPPRLVHTEASKKHLSDLFKGRETPYNIGEKNHLAKLTEDGVRYILSHPEKNYLELAHELGVSKNTVQYVTVGKTWKHIDRSEFPGWVSRQGRKPQYWDRI